MPICLQFVKPVGAAGGPQTQLHVVNDTTIAQPADLSQCAMIGITGPEYGAALMMANPPSSVGTFDPSLAGSYFGLAFASTVGLWAAAYGCGQLVKFIKK